MRYKELLTFIIICCFAGCNKSDNPVVNSNNSPPVITSVTFIPDTVIAGQSCLVEVKAVDPDNDKISYHWESTGTISGSGTNVILTPGACCGAPPLIITIDDGKGGTVDTNLIVPFRY